MQGKPYKLYHGSRTGRRFAGLRRPEIRRPCQVSGAEAAGRPVTKGTVRPRARWGRWLTAALILAGAGMVLYAAWVFGAGLVQARVEQGRLRSLFTVSGNGSLESDYISDEARALQSRLEHLDPVGEIDLPATGIRWMMVEGSDDAALARGPGHIEETSLPGYGGNFAVAGDRVLYGAPFLRLDEVSPGDEIRVRMPYATFVYRVERSFIVTPDDVSVLQDAGYEAITLLTCDPPWDIKQRIVIRGRLEQTLPAGT